VQKSIKKARKKGARRRLKSLYILFMRRGHKARARGMFSTVKPPMVRVGGGHG